MSVQQYVIRYFNPKLHSKPVQDAKTGRYHGGHDGWTEFYVNGQKTAKLKANEMAALVGKQNVTLNPFNDPVKNPYKRRPERSKFVRRDRDTSDSYDLFDS